jgi:hypothetical protein
MSIGNLKDYGNKGNNFPWQLKMLQGIDALLSAFTSSTSSFLAPETRTTSIIRPTTTGTITAGAKSVSIANVGAANGSVKNVALKPGETISFDGGALNNTLDAIAYVATNTEFLIITIV